MIRRGIGRRLMSAMEGVLSDSGAQEASLHATLNAIAFYRALSYGAATPTINVLPLRCPRSADVAPGLAVSVRPMPD
jgi:hypothetical protein